MFLGCNDKKYTGLQRRMNCLFITAGVGKSEIQNQAVVVFRGPQPPTPFPSGEGGGADIVTILPCAVATVSTSTYVTQGGGLFFSLSPRGVHIQKGW